MTDDELDELREQEQAILDELEGSVDADTRERLESALFETQEQIEELEESQDQYMVAFMLDMFAGDEGGDSDGDDWDADFDLLTDTH